VTASGATSMLTPLAAFKMTGTVGGATFANSVGGTVAAVSRLGAGIYTISTPSWPEATTKIAVASTSAVALGQFDIIHDSAIAKTVIMKDALGNSADGLTFDVLVWRT
jgi:hypothetical protein